MYDLNRGTVSGGMGLENENGEHGMRNGGIGLTQRRVVWRLLIR